jgi:PST family polysaccharide transporter
LLKNGLLIAALAALVLWLIAPALVPIVFGADFAPAAETLRILTPALPLIFLNTALFYVFVAARRRMVYTTALGLGIGIGGLLCAVLAPRYGGAGCAMAGVVRELIVSGVYLHCLARGAHAPAVAGALLKVFLGATALILGGAALFMATGRDLWLAAWMVCVVAGTLVLLGFPRLREWRLLTDDNL